MKDLFTNIINEHADFLKGVGSAAIGMVISVVKLDGFMGDSLEVLRYLLVVLTIIYTAFKFYTDYKKWKKQ